MRANVHGGRPHRPHMPADNRASVREPRGPYLRRSKKKFRRTIRRASLASPRANAASATHIRRWVRAGFRLSRLRFDASVERNSVMPRLSMLESFSSSILAATRSMRLAGSSFAPHRRDETWRWSCIAIQKENSVDRGLLQNLANQKISAAREPQIFVGRENGYLSFSVLLRKRRERCSLVTLRSVVQNV